MSRRSALLEFAVLGLLHDAPLHGYELRKQLTVVLGPFRTLSYGTLYPRLRAMVERGWITSTDEPDTTSTSKRSRITYELTDAGREHFQTHLMDAGPSAWEDGSFDVHVTFFARTESKVRLRILEGRRARLEERMEFLKANHRCSTTEDGRSDDVWACELHRHGLESTQREVRWVSQLIEAERAGRPATGPDPSQPPAAKADGSSSHLDKE